jgi:hypothetical protein
MIHSAALRLHPSISLGPLVVACVALQQRLSDARMRLALQAATVCTATLLVPAAFLCCRGAEGAGPCESFTRQGMPFCPPCSLVVAFAKVRGHGLWPAAPPSPPGPKAHGLVHPQIKRP